MDAFIIEQAGVVKEAFAYERPLNEGSRQALIEYAKATYGDDAELRAMTAQEQADFVLHGAEYFV